MNVLYISLWKLQLFLGRHTPIVGTFINWMVSASLALVPDTNPAAWRSHDWVALQPAIDLHFSYYSDVLHCGFMGWDFSVLFMVCLCDSKNVSCNENLGLSETGTGKMNKDWKGLKRYLLMSVAVELLWAFVFCFLISSVKGCKYVSEAATGYWFICRQPGDEQFSQCF